MGWGSSPPGRPTVTPLIVGLGRLSVQTRQAGSDEAVETVELRPDRGRTETGEPIGSPPVLGLERLDQAAPLQAEISSTSVMIA